MALWVLGVGLVALEWPLSPRLGLSSTSELPPLNLHLPLGLGLGAVWVLGLGLVGWEQPLSATPRFSGTGAASEH